MPREPNQGRKVRQRIALILTALPDEFRAVVKHLKKLGDGKAFDSIGTHYFVGTFTAKNGEIWTVYVGSSGAGNFFAANLASAAITAFNPDFAILTGISGALDPKELGKGGVIAASEVCYSEHGSVKKSAEHRPVDFRCSYRLVQAAMAVAREGNWPKRRKGHRDNSGQPPKGMVGVIVAGEKVVKSSESTYCKFLKKRFPKALSVEMEGAGFMAAAHQFPAVPAIVIRGISDELNDKSKTDKAGWQQIAASNVAAFVFELVDSLPDQDDDFRNTVLSKGPPPLPPDPGFSWSIKDIHVPKGEEPQFFGIVRQLSKISTTTVVPVKKADSKLSITLLGCSGIGKSAVILEQVRPSKRLQRVEHASAIHSNALPNVARYSCKRSVIIRMDVVPTQKTRQCIATLELAINKHLLDQFKAAINSRLGLNSHPDVPELVSAIPPRVAPSIVTRSEAILHGHDDLQFAIRMYLDSRGSFVNIRPLSNMAVTLLAGGGCQTYSTQAVDHSLVSDDVLRTTKTSAIEPIADAVLVPSDRMRADYTILTAKLGDVYGEVEPVNGTPYVRQMNTRGGGACAQACLFMVSALLHEWVSMPDTRAQVHGLVEIDAVARGFGSAKHMLNGMTVGDMMRYLDLTGKTASLEEVGLKDDREGSVTTFSLRLRAHLQANLPVIVIVNSEKLHGLDVSNSNGATGSGDVNHAVVVIGASKHHDGFLINDPAGKPFTQISASKLFNISLSPSQEATSVARFIAVGPKAPLRDSVKLEQMARSQRWSEVSSAMVGRRKLEPVLVTPLCFSSFDQSRRNFFVQRKRLSSDAHREDFPSLRASTSSRLWLKDEMDRIVAMYCFASGLTSEQPQSGEDSADNVFRTLLLARKIRRCSPQSRGGDMLPVILSVGNRLGGMQRVIGPDHGESLFANCRSTARVLDLLVSRLERIVRHSRLTPSDGIYLAIDLEPGPLYAINDLGSLSEVAKRLSKNPLLCNLVGFNLDIAHFALAGITPGDLSSDDAVCSRIVHATFSDHGPGHFGDGTLSKSRLVGGADFEDKLAPLKEWLKLIHQRILNARVASRSFVFSPYVSVKLDANCTFEYTRSTIHALRRLVNGEMAVAIANDDHVDMTGASDVADLQGGSSHGRSEPGTTAAEPDRGTTR